jgi:CBS domain-containing protein
MKTTTRTTSNLRVSDLVHRSPVTVHPDDTLRDVAVVLSREEIGAVAVRGSGEVTGIVSERDLARALAEGADPDDDRAGDVMTYDLVSVGPEALVHDAAVLMLGGQIRHLPVVQDGHVIGIISMRDVLDALEFPTP